MKDYDPQEALLQNIRRLIWLYFWLLLFEGALRKWVVPPLSNPLLIVRDPVVLLAYFLAIKARIFPTNGWVLAAGAIGVLSALITFVPLWSYIPPVKIAFVTAFGFRSNFLHLPMIFLIGRVMGMEDLKRVGWWALIMVVPMAMLMVAQFQSPPDSFLNRNVGGEGEMMTSALGRVRTAGTFSFVVGVVAYFSLAAGFLIWAALRRDVYKNWLLFAAGSAMVIGIAVCGSRSVVGACAVVMSSLFVILFVRPAAMNRFGQTVLVTLILGFIVTQTPIFKIGLNVLTTRFNEVAWASERSIGAGIVDRVVGDYVESFHVLAEAPFLGYGLGVGTNAGAKFITGENVYLLHEGEWSRVFLESGPVLGVAFIAWRCAIVGWLGLLCLRSVKQGDTLSLLLFSSAFMPMISGHFGQPTIMGFVIFATGLALAARREHEDFTPEDESEVEEESLPPPGRSLPRRSAYASRLHGPGTGQNHQNGSADR